MPHVTKSEFYAAMAGVWAFMIGLATRGLSGVNSLTQWSGRLLDLLAVVMVLTYIFKATRAREAGRDRAE